MKASPIAIVIASERSGDPKSRSVWNRTQPPVAVQRQASARIDLVRNLLTLAHISALNANIGHRPEPAAAGARFVYARIDWLRFAAWRVIPRLDTCNKPI